MPIVAVAIIGATFHHGTGAALAADGTLKLVAIQSTIPVGGDVSVEVSFSTAGSADAVAAVLTYPQELLEYREVSPSSAWPVKAATSGGSGKVTIEVGSFTPVSGTAPVATVKFRVLGNGVASLSLAQESVALLAGENLSLTTQGEKLTLGTGAPASASKRPSLRVALPGAATNGQVGDTTKVTVTVSNSADAARSNNAHALVSVGAGLSITSVQPPTGRSCTTSTVVDCVLGDLAPGQSASLVVTTRLDTAGSWQLVARVEQDGQDANPSDDSSSLAFTVTSKETGSAPPGTTSPTGPVPPKSKRPTRFVAALVKVTKVGGRLRKFALTFVVNRPSSTNIQMVARTKKTVVSKKFVLAKGRTILVVQAPRKASAGWYRFKIKIASTDGALRMLNRPVRIAA
jgi:hypothetical protein